MKQYQLEIFRKTAEFINENTRGCRNKEDEMVLEFIKSQRDQLYDECLKKVR